MRNHNENNRGYKNTKVGWIPKHWNSHAFGVVVNESQYGLSVTSSSEGNIALLRMGNISNGKVIYENLTYVDISNSDAKKYLIGKNNLLFNRTNSLEHVGKTGLVIEPQMAVFASYLVRFKLIEEMAFPNFITYYFNTKNSRNKLRKLATPGVCQYNINQSELQKQFFIPIPPLPEQKKIAEIISAWDESIQLTTKLLDTKKTRKKALMQQLLTGKIRLPGFRSGAQLITQPFFEMPDDWPYPKIKDIAKVCLTRNDDKRKIVVLSCSKYKGFVESEKYFGKQVYSQDTSNYKVIKKGWFGYPSNHIEEGSIGLLSTHEEGIVSPIYTVFCVDSSVHEKYLYALFKTNTYRHIFKITTNASVDRRGSLRWREFSLIHIPLPSLQEQKAIAKILTTADEEIKVLDEKLGALQKQKKGLMQKLLTGAIRVKV